MDEESERLELETANGNDDQDRRVIDEIKTSDKPFTSDFVNGWSMKRYLGALIGKSARAAQGAYQYTSDDCGSLGKPVKGLEGE